MQRGAGNTCGLRQALGRFPGQCGAVNRKSLLRPNFVSHGKERGLARAGHAGDERQSAARGAEVT